MPDLIQSHTLTTTPTQQKRHAKEARFKWYGRIAIGLSLGFLVFMFSAIFFRGVGAFTQTRIQLDINFAESLIDPTGERNPDMLARVNTKPLLKSSLSVIFPDVTSRRDTHNLLKLLSISAEYEIEDKIKANPEIIGTQQTLWLTSASQIDLYLKGKINTDVDESLRKLSDQDIVWIKTLIDQGRIKQKFNTTFFTKGDSREPEMAGILGAALGSFFSLVVCFAIAFPLGILTAVYLEEYAKKNWITDIIEININNLAAVPSIVFGLLGLSIFLNVFNLPRSTPLVGGMVLALMTLPTIIIAARASLRSVPNSIRDAALGMGASKTQTTFHHVVPLATPGMLTGTILGMAQALGETAPLLMIGMVAFIVDVPSSVTDMATSLPVQIFLWADSPEKGFVERTSAAIIVLLVFLVLMNLLAVYLRKKLERPKL
ncbi:MAG: phosphate ABC transporter, permease protein PstA [Robiginitomaculum sp.]|nr:MAG: phosphate ABC transporter, permease protein PstA [Robiginitomaculum sp.]